MTATGSLARRLPSAAPQRDLPSRFTDQLRRFLRLYHRHATNYTAPMGSAIHLGPVGHRVRPGIYRNSAKSVRLPGGQRARAVVVAQQGDGRPGGLPWGAALVLLRWHVPARFT